MIFDNISFDKRKRDEFQYLSSCYSFFGFLLAMIDDEEAIEIFCENLTKENLGIISNRLIYFAEILKEKL